MSNFWIGVISSFAFIGIISTISFALSTWKLRRDEHKVIKEFCKENDYCYFGCGQGNGGYYGGYNCKSDHK